jgi:2-octaprenylphenol hydroxylase
MSQHYDYDVVIAGGGMVGAALACALGDSPLQVALVEGTPLDQVRPTAAMDVRVSAISRASQRLFAAVGAWEAMTAWRVSPFREMRVWDAAGSGQIHFDSATLGEPLLGWIIENRVIQTALLERAQGLANVELLCPNTLSLASLRDGGVHLQLQQGGERWTRLLVGADGARSPVRLWAGIDSGGWGYGQQAVVANVATGQPHVETAWQRFLPTGPLAFLPLADGRCSIVWSTTSAQANHLLALDEAGFALELAEAFDWRLGAITGVGPRAAFPLYLQYAQSYVKPNVALIGDAAHVVHPLAGQGVNLGLLDAAALAEVLLDAVAAGQEVGALRVLRRYERWRRGENLLMLGVMDGFKRLFGTGLAPVRWLRNWGLSLTDAAEPVKNLLARRAMGLSGDLPRLARG